MGRQLSPTPTSISLFPLQEFSTASDVWSYGVVLWEMFSLGAIPYPGMEPGMRLYEFLARGERMRCPERCPGYAYDIMLGCWHADPASRLTFDRIVALLVREIRLGGERPQRVGLLIAERKTRGRENL